MAELANISGKSYEKLKKILRKTYDELNQSINHLFVQNHSTTI